MDRWSYGECIGNYFPSSFFSLKEKKKVVDAEASRKEGESDEGVYTLQKG